MVFPLNYCSCFNTNKALLRNLEYSAVANRLEKFCVHTIILKKGDSLGIITQSP